MAYKLSDVLRGHEMDVRGVCRSVFPQGGLISVSRDRTVRVWKKDEFSKEFIEGQCFSGHQGFVAAVCTMPESDKYPHGMEYKIPVCRAWQVHACCILYAQTNSGYRFFIFIFGTNGHQN
jgi:hypothetical protein